MEERIRTKESSSRKKKTKHLMYIYYPQRASRKYKSQETSLNLPFEEECSKNQKKAIGNKKPDDRNSNGNRRVGREKKNRRRKEKIM